MVAPEAGIDADELLVGIDGAVMTMTLNRPRVSNAITTRMATDLGEAIKRLESTPELAVGVITGAGGGFCAGLDLKEMGRSGTPRGLRTLVRSGCRKPLVAAVEGYALAGGLEIALVCDLIVAGRGARLGLPEASVGLLAAAGGLLGLSSRLPGGVVRRMALTADPLLAEDGERYGLVAQTSEPGKALADAQHLAHRVARNAPLSLAATKKLLSAMPGLSPAEFRELESEAAERVFASRDAREGPVAFSEKRPPHWTGT